MATYILMTKLSPNVTKEMKKRETIGKAWKAKVQAKCPQVKFISHYALLGPYDFMDIYEAPNQEMAAKVAMITLSEGAVTAETWGAIPYTRFLKMAKDL